MWKFPDYGKSTINKRFHCISLPAGNCVTSVDEDDVCGLDSESTGCSEEYDLATIDCQCYAGVVSEDCEGRSVDPPTKY